MRRVVETLGPCTMSPLPDPFEALMLAIFSQQVSVKGAETLYARFRSRFTRPGPTPRKVLAALDPESPRRWDDEAIRGVGISRQKRAYLVDLCRHVLDGRLPLAGLGDLDDAEVTARLTAVKGVGEWTAHMHLMFVLMRPDVLPVGDLGLREGARRAYGLDERPDAVALEKLAEPWRPCRSVATWYLWKFKGD